MNLVLKCLGAKDLRCLSIILWKLSNTSPSKSEAFTFLFISNNERETKFLLAPVELPMVEVADYMLTSSNFT